MSKKEVGFGQWVKFAAAAAIAAQAALLGGCSSSQGPVVTSQKQAEELARRAADARSKGDAAKAQALSREAADKYARLGELMMLPEGVMYADEFFSKALEQDPANRKANFYKSVTGPAMVSKGVLSMIEPLVLDSENLEALDKARSDIKGYKMPELAQLAYEIPNDGASFTSYYDAQRFMRVKMLPALQAGLARLEKIDFSTPLKLNFTPERMKINPVREGYTGYSSYCYSDPNQGWICSNYSYSYTSDSGMRNEYFLDQYDAKAIKAVYTAMIDSVRLGTAYSMNGSDRLLPRLKAVDLLRLQQGGQGLTVQDTVEVIKEFPHLLVLEDDQQLAPIAESTSAAVKAGLELDEMKSQLCDDRSTRNDGNSTFHPICISIDTVQAFHQLFETLAGPRETELGLDLQGNHVTIVMDASRLLKHPVRDLKTLLPTSFGPSGVATNWADPTLGGLFPNGDFVAKLQQLGTADVSGRVASSIQDRIRHTKDHL